MVTFVGKAVQELGYTFPGSLDLAGNYAFVDVLKDGIGFSALSNIPLFGLIHILLFVGIAETIAMPAGEYIGGPQNLTEATTDLQE